MGTMKDESMMDGPMDAGSVRYLYYRARRLCEDLNTDPKSWTGSRRAQALLLAARFAMQGVENILFSALMADRLED